MKIGCFSAASNVTGIRTDVDAITALLHENDALAFWDYAAAAPYIDIKMNHPSDKTGLYDKDAIMISPHKFIGGPGTPGVLIVKRKLLKNTVPSQPGGGTVSYVSTHDHRYLSDIEVREEGGTPAIIESIRTGLVFQLKDEVGATNIAARDEAFRQRAFKAWANNPNIQILGNKDAPRLAIISFIIKCGDKALHHDFVVSLLNDLFGIQSRGGCSCAGPYGHRLLNINDTQSRQYEKLVLQGYNGLKPGWVRLGFNYFFDDETVDYIISAVDMIATHGWKLLPFYSFNEHTGIWRHKNTPKTVQPCLNNISYQKNQMDFLTSRSDDEQKSMEEYLASALQIFNDPNNGDTQPQSPSDDNQEDGLKDTENLRWFLTPQEGLVDLQAVCDIPRG